MTIRQSVKDDSGPISLLCEDAIVRILENMSVLDTDRNVARSVA